MKQITSPKELKELVSELGFLPFFKNEIPRFSVEDYTPQRLWFSDTADGPWKWKERIMKHLEKLLPQADENKIRRLLCS